MNLISKSMIRRLIISLCLISPALFAGQQCKSATPDAMAFKKASAKALALREQLAYTHPKVALIARVGSDLHKYGIHYTHLAFIINENLAGKARWRVVHLLNECGTPYSSIYKQGLMNFFLDNLYQYDYQLIIPDKALQDALWINLQKNKIEKFHQRRYNMIAYPFSTAYQNSNQWVLEVFVASASQNKPTTRKAIQNDLLHTGFHARAIYIDPLSRAGARVFSNNVRFDDHPIQALQSSRFQTLTVDSVTNYLNKRFKIIITEH